MPDEVREALFPVSGIDVSCEVDRQTPRTTARGVNVRACDPRTLRVRGAARPGLTKLLGDTVSGLAGFPVQHLNVIVDPTVAALLASDPAAMSPPGAIPDPSTNNAAGGSTDPNDPLVRNPDRTIRPGGSGIQPNRHVPAAPPPSVQFVQEVLHISSGTSGTETDTLPAPPNLGDLIVVFAVTASDPGTFTPTRVSAVTSGTGDNFVQVGGSLYFAEQTSDYVGHPDQVVSLSVWYRVATGGSDDQTVTATAGGSTAIGFGAFVFRGLAAGSPFTDKAKAEVFATTQDYKVTGLNLNGTSPQLVVAVFYAFNNGSPVPAAGYVARIAGYGMAVAVFASVTFIYKATASGVGPETAEAIDSTGVPEGGYVGIAASFHR